MAPQRLSGRNQRLLKLAKLGGKDKELFLLDEIEKVNDRIDLATGHIKGKDGKDAITPTDKELLKLIYPLIPAPKEGKPGHIPTAKELLALIRPLIPKVKNGDTPSDQRLLALIRPLIPVITVPQGSPDTPDDIREKLEGLKGEDRLDSSAIKNLPEATQQIAIKAGWGAHPLVIQGLGAVIDKNTRVINFAGSGLVSVVRSPSGVVTVTLQSGSGTIYTETPTGLIDGSNKTYTTLHSIGTVFNFAINGQFLHPTADYTVAGNTITMVTALPASLSGLPFTMTYQ